jgi:cyclase
LIELLRADAHRGGLPVTEAADRLELGEFAALLEPERVVINLDRAYAEIDPGHRPMSLPDLMPIMAAYAERHPRASA